MKLKESQREILIDLVGIVAILLVMGLLYTFRHSIL